MGIVPKKTIPGRRIMVFKISTSRYGVTGYTGFFDPPTIYIFFLSELLYKYMYTFIFD